MDILNGCWLSGAINTPKQQGQQLVKSNVLERTREKDEKREQRFG
jgi:hypothetical protein